MFNDHYYHWKLHCNISQFCQFYSLEFYNRSRDIVGRPLFVIYGLLILTMAVTYRQLLVKEYKKYKLAAKTGIAALGGMTFKY